MDIFSQMKKKVFFNTMSSAKEDNISINNNVLKHTTDDIVEGEIEYDEEHNKYKTTDNNKAILSPKLHYQSS